MRFQPKPIQNQSPHKPVSLRLPTVTPATCAGVLTTTVALWAATPLPALADASEAARSSAPIEDILVQGSRGRNPFADPEAPYKVDKSASSKLSESLLDTAKSIAVIPEEIIEDIGAMSFRDVMRTQPGVTLGTGEGGNAFGDRIFIRGFDARNDVYVDGLRDPGVISREVFAVQQVEILKGPSSAFGGRGTTGGAVSLVSKAPQTDTFADAEVTVGTDNTKRVTTDVNAAISDTLAVRLNALYHDAGVAGRDEVNSERWGVAAAALYRPRDNLSFAVDYYHLDADALPDWGVPYDLANNRPFQVNRKNFYGLVERDFMKNKADIITGKVNYDVSDKIILENTLRYGRTTNAYVVSAPEGPQTSDPNPANWTVRASPKNRNAVNKYWANQTDATIIFDTGGIAHTFITGVELSKETITNRPCAFLNSEDPSTGNIVSPYTVIQNLWNPNPHLSWPFPVTESGALTETKVRSKAIYALDTIKFSEQWELFGALRYDDLEVDQMAVTAAGVVTQRDYNKGFFNWQASLVYKPLENGTFYISSASSSNPSGEQVDASNTAYGGLSGSTEDLDPERNKTYEAGVKWSVFDQHLLLAAAVFRIDKVNARVSTGGGASELTTLDGKQRVDGFEISFTGNITPAWSVFGGLTLLDSKIRESRVAADVGKKFPNIAHTSASFLTRYQILEDLHLGGQATYVGKRYGGTVTALTTSIPGYWRFDAFGGYKVTDDVEISFNVLNLTNKTYYDALYRSAAPFTYIAPGRSALLTVDVDF